MIALALGLHPSRLPPTKSEGAPQDEVMRICIAMQDSRARCLTSWIGRVRSAWRRDRQAADLMAFDEPGDKAGRFHLFDKAAQERRARGVFPRRTDRLLHRGKPPIDDARAGEFFQVGEKPRPQAGERVELAAHK